MTRFEISPDSRGVSARVQAANRQSQFRLLLEHGWLDPVLSPPPSPADRSLTDGLANRSVEPWNGSTGH